VPVVCRERSGIPAVNRRGQMGWTVPSNNAAVGGQLARPLERVFGSRKVSRCSYRPRGWMRVCGRRFGRREADEPTAGRVRCIGLGRCTYPSPKTSDACVAHPFLVWRRSRRCHRKGRCRAGIVPQFGHFENRLDPCRGGRASRSRHGMGQQLLQNGSVSAVRTRFRPSGHAGAPAASGVKSRGRRRWSVSLTTCCEIALPEWSAVVGVFDNKLRNRAAGVVGGGRRL
jgi:hypothetical protein